MQTNHDRPTLTASTEENDQRDLTDVGRGLAVTPGEGRTDGNESNPILYSNSQRGNSDREKSSSEGQGTTGKMLRQLRDLQEAHLAYINNYRKSVEEQLKVSNEYQEKIIENIQVLEKQLLDILDQQESE